LGVPGVSSSILVLPVRSRECNTATSNACRKRATKHLKPLCKITLTALKCGVSNLSRWVVIRLELRIFLFSGPHQSTSLWGLSAWLQEYSILSDHSNPQFCLPWSAQQAFPSTDPCLATASYLAIVSATQPALSGVWSPHDSFSRRINNTA
jgi:hypothetical protein